jgi:hypothetical protein
MPQGSAELENHRKYFTYLMIIVKDEKTVKK